MKSDTTTDFLLLSTPRAGTHMVRSSLNQHPEVTCYGELFHPMRNTWYPECAGLPCEQLECWMRENTSKNCCGFAIHYGDQANDVAKEYWARRIHEPTLPILYVFRRNQLRQTLSQLRSQAAHQLKGSGGWMSYRPDSPDHARFGWTVDALTNLGRITVNCKRFHSLTVRREANEIMFLADRRFCRICPVAYEDFVDDGAAEMDRICEFLEVDAHYSAPETERTGFAPLSQLILNYAEFKGFFSQTPYAHFLDDD